MGRDRKESTSGDLGLCPCRMLMRSHALGQESSAPPFQAHTEQKYFILMLLGLSLWAAKSYFV